MCSQVLAPKPEPGYGARGDDDAEAGCQTEDHPEGHELGPDERAAAHRLGQDEGGGAGGTLGRDAAHRQEDGRDRAELPQQADQDVHDVGHPGLVDSDLRVDLAEHPRDRRERLDDDRQGNPEDDEQAAHDRDSVRAPGLHDLLLEDRSVASHWTTSRSWPTSVEMSVRSLRTATIGRPVATTAGN